MSKLFSCDYDYYERYHTNGMVKCGCVKEEKMMDIDCSEEYLKGVYQSNYYYGSVKKRAFSFCSDLQIDKKIQCKRRPKEKN